MPEDAHSASAPKTLKQRFGAQVGKFNNYYGELTEGRYTLTFDRSVENRINLHVGSPDEPAVASTLYSEDFGRDGTEGPWFTNDGQNFGKLHDAAEHLIAIRAQPRGEIEGGDATEVQGHPKVTVTGRLSAGEPEMQTLRPVIQADPQIDTETLRSADFSDFEQRILARMTPEQIEAFKRGEGVAVDLDGLTPKAMPCKEVIVIGGGRGDDLFGGGERRTAKIDMETYSRHPPLGAAEQGHRMHLGLSIGLALAGAAALLNREPRSEQDLFESYPMRRVTPSGVVTPKKAKTRSSYSPCKASVTDQHKGSKSAKTAARQAQKVAKAQRRARRARKGKSNG